MNLITIDGLSGSGKGTLAKALAKKLQWHYLDSGALYRVVAYLAQCRQLIDEDGNPTQGIEPICDNIAKTDIHFEDEAVYVAGSGDINPFIRNEDVGKKASVLATNLQLRQALLVYQRQCFKNPGLVADGRDMGTTVFPQASLKLFLTASIKERAKRRYLQLINSGNNANLAALVKQLELRDENDLRRKHSPLTPAEDAIVIDSSNQDIQQVYSKVWGLVKQCFFEIEIDWAINLPDKN